MFVRMRGIGATGPTHTKPLKEEKAVEVGAEILGEAFIYSVAATFILFEYWRSGKQEAKLEAHQDKDIDVLKDRMTKVEEKIMLMDSKLEKYFQQKK